VMIQMKDYQLVAKKQVAKTVPPFSSPVLLCLFYVFIRLGCRAILVVDLVH